MKAISLWQPWASLVAVGEKKWETRGYMRSHRGLLAIHAAKIPLPAEQYARNPPFSSSLALHGIQFDDLPFGALVAVVNFTEIITAGQWMRLHCKTPINPRADREYCFGDYAPGRFAWKFEDVHRLAKPIPYTGRQGIFNLDDATAAAIEADHEENEAIHPLQNLRSSPTKEKMNNTLPMKPHDFEVNPTYPEECRRCGDSYDAPVHELDGVPVGEAEDEGPDDIPADWPPNVVAYLEAVGIRQPA